MTATTTTKVYVDKSVCAGCGMCQRVCQAGAITIRSGLAVIDEKKCIGCGRCIDACPRGSIYRYTPMTRENLENMVDSLKKNADSLMERIEKLKKKTQGINCDGA